MNCAFAEKVSALIDGELTGSESSAVELHLLECRECQELRRDFLSVGNELGSFALPPSQEMSSRLAQRLAPPARSNSLFPGNLGALRWQPLLAGAAVILLAAVFALVLFLRSQYRNAGLEAVLKDQPRQTPSPSPVASPTPQPASQKPADQETDQAPPKFRRRETVTQVPSGRSPRSLLKPDSAEIASTRDRVEPEDTAGVMDASFTAASGAADTQSMTARHVEQSELLLRSFRNLRSRSSDLAGELSYERRRAQKLFYQNVMLRREADTSGDIEVASLLESLEPILLDIANLPQGAPGTEVRAIKDRVERQNLVALLQINSLSQARTKE